MYTHLDGYETPQLTVLGTLAELTKASFTSSQTDSIFFAGVPVGNATGSRDACVAEDPQQPSGQCLFD